MTHPSPQSCIEHCSWILIRDHAIASCGPNKVWGGGFWGLMLTFVVDATKDDV